MVGQDKTPGPPQQAGQKRKSNHSNDSTSHPKRPKTDRPPITTGKANGYPPNKHEPKPNRGPSSFKHPKNGPAANSRVRRAQTKRTAHALATQTTGKAFSDGALDVEKFVKAREFEIHALQEGLARSRRARMERAFQAVPRELRRRAGAWEAGRVPKAGGRREKARREMREDNTPSGKERRRPLTREARVRVDTVKRLRALGAKRKEKQAEDKAAGKKGGVHTREAKRVMGKLKEPARVKSRFRKRQLNKTWLPTHLFHAKRAHMSPPMQPVWRFALPLTPTAKAYRPTHRAVSERGAVAWDVSYMSTVGLEGQEKSLLNLLRALGVDETALTGRKGRLWRHGRRTWQGWLYGRDSYMQNAICPATVIWRTTSEEEQKVLDDTTSTSKPPRRKLFLRVHPSAFMQVWQEVVQLCRVQKPEVKAEDLRFEIGGIEIMGPVATEALQGALWPSSTEASDNVSSFGKLWQSLRGLDNPASLPANSTLPFGISDPRLHHPPRTIAAETNPGTLLQTLVNFDNDIRASPQGIFDSRTRRAAVAAMQSQKGIDRRKGAAAPGAYPAALPTDPAFPVLLYTSTTVHSRGSTSSQKTGSWTVVLPWKAVAPVWQSIMYYPLSTGGQVRFGGLREQRQIAFERCEAWFPGDFPGTEAGDSWEEREEDVRKKAWERRPRSRRVNFEELDLGNGEKGETGQSWAMDWSLVLSGLTEEPRDNNTNTLDTKKQPEQNETTSASKAWHCAPPLARALLASPPTNDKSTVVSPEVSRSELAKAITHSETVISTAIVTVRITLLGRGTPDPAARIYRLPSDANLRAQWLDILNRLASRKTFLKPPPNRLLPPLANGEGSDKTDLRQLARDLLGLDGDDTEKDHPPVPKTEDLIGFVTSGAFNLREGRGTAVGSVGLERFREAKRSAQEFAGHKKSRELWQSTCIVRNSGETVGRLARLELL